MMAALFLSGAAMQADNIDPYEIGNKYAYSENTGWLNFAPSLGDGVQVSSSAVTGKVWGENIGWVNLSPATYGGVVNDGSGNLSGYAWGENIGWINFDPDVPGDASNQYKVTIDADGVFSGWGYGENIGWIHFDNTQNWNASACVVTIEDMRNLASYWLQTGSSPGDLDGTNVVDLKDYSILASYWQDFCPDGWLLKLKEDVFPDNYDGLTAGHIQSLDAELSTENIDASNGNEFYPGTYFAYHTNDGRYGKFLVENLDVTQNNKLTIAWVTYNSDGSIYTSGSGLAVRGTYNCDLDAGLEGGTGYDWQWNMSSSTTRYLSPRNGSRFILLYRAVSP